jgi:hypothetical protein
MIFWKKACVVLGIVATIPVAFIGGCAIGVLYALCV